MNIAYLDYNATAPVRPEAAAAVAAALEVTGNASSVHRCGRYARRLVEDAREQVAALAGVGPDRVVFTSGGTEANDLVLNGCGARSVLVSAVEHPSVLDARADAAVLGVDGEGRVDPAGCAGAVRGLAGPALVSVMAANNETGVLQPVDAVAEIARAAGVRLHCDAVQAAGRVDLAPIAAVADYLTLSAHKIGGPQGAGAVIVGADAPLQARLRGGGQERGRRAGTQNVPAIAGFGAAAVLAQRDLARAGELARLRDDLEARLRAHHPGVRFPGAGAPRVANTSCIAVAGLSAETQVIALDLAAVAVSAGAACSSGKVARSPVLDAMGVGDDLAGSAIRVSLGWASTADDVDRFVSAWCRMLADAGIAAVAAA